MPLFVWHPNYTSLTLIRGTRYELATCSGVGLAHMLTSQYVLIPQRVQQFVGLAFLSFRTSSILSKGIPINALGPLLPTLCPFVLNQHISYVHLGLLPAVL